MIARAVAFAIAASLAPIAAIAADEARFAEGRLWRISKAGVADSYVLGTIHLADPRVAAIPEPAREALDRSRLLALELVPEAAVEGPEQDQEQFDDGRRLAPLLGAEAYDQVHTLLAAARVPERAIERMKPWAALLRVSRVDGDARSLDELLYAAARERRIPATSLEWIDEQIAAFDTIPLDSQVALLKHVLANREAVAAMAASTIDAWLRGDLAALARVDERIDAQFPGMGRHYRELAKQIIDGRTALMHHRLFLPLRAGRVFVAVGASHLPGEQGLLARLERDGYRVTRIW